MKLRHLMGVLSLSVLCVGLSRCATAKQDKVVTVVRVYVPELELPHFPAISPTYDEATDMVSMSLADFEAIYVYKVAVDAAQDAWQAMKDKAGEQ